MLKCYGPCGLYKEEYCFHKNKSKGKRAHASYCIDCWNNRRQEKIDIINVKRREKWHQNKEKINKKRREDRAKKIELYKQTDEYKLKQIEKNEQRKLNKLYKKVRMALSSAMYRALKRNAVPKDMTTFEILEYSLDEYLQHLESFFTLPGNEWMNWTNHGVYRKETWDDNDKSTWTWHIDHIIPQSKLPYDSINHPNFKKCWSLSNLRPYPAKLNIWENKRK